MKPLVFVVWKDAHGSATGAYEESEIPHAAIEVISYGVLLRDDEVGVSIASEVCDNNIYRGYTFIPRSLVVRVEEVIKKRKKKLSLTPSGKSNVPIMTNDE